MTSQPSPRMVIVDLDGRELRMVDADTQVTEGQACDSGC